MRIKNIALLAILVLLFSLVFAACANYDEPAAQPAAEAAVVPEAPAAVMPDPEDVYGRFGAGDGIARLSYSFWGGDLERIAQMDAVQQFNEIWAGYIEVTPIHIPAAGGEYAIRITAMRAAGTNPDVATMLPGLGFVWAQEGVFFNILELIDNDPYLTRECVVDNLFYMWDYDKSFGHTSSINPRAIFYCPDVFTEHGVPFPPVHHEEAWEWDQFIHYAQLLTIDFNGNNALHPDFDPLRIRQFGVHFNPDDMVILGLMLDTNGADFLTVCGNYLALDTPEAREVLQRLYDMIYVYHVSPIPGDYANLPSGANAIYHRQFGMVVTGYWNILDFDRMGVNFGVGVLPVMTEPRNVKDAGVRVIFANSRYPLAAWELYKFLSNPAGALSLYRDGLWMPTRREWYLNPDLFEQWAGEGSAHPPYFWEVFVEGLFNGVSTPSIALRIRNSEELIQNAVRPALQQLWFEDMTIDEVIADVTARANPFVRGFNPGMHHASYYWQFQR